MLRIVAVLALALSCGLATPHPALAVGVNPLDALDDLLGAGANAISGGIAGAAVDGFGAILRALFAVPARLINRELLAWLVAVPDYAIHPETSARGHEGSNLAELAGTTTAMAFAGLGAVGTVAGIRYWAAGLTGVGGLGVLEGMARTLAAAFVIVLWPWLFRHAADLANQAGRTLLGSGSVLDDTAHLLGLVFAGGVSFNILSVLMAVGAAFALLALLVSKIAVSALTALVFVGMPLALMLWPMPELAWIARTALRAFATVLVIPLAWAVCFATFAAVSVDALALKGAGTLADALIMPLVALALLAICASLPKTLMRMALLGAVGGGVVGRTASYIAMRRADAAVAHAIPGGFGGHHGQPLSTAAAGGSPATTAVSGVGAAVRTARAATPSQPPRAADATRGAAVGDASPHAPGGAAQHLARPLVASADPPATPRDTGAAIGATQQHAGDGAWTPPPGFPRAAPTTPSAGGAAGLPTPAWREIRDRVPIELAAAAARQPQTHRADVAAAMRALSSDARQGVLELMRRHDGEIRGQMAHQAARGDLEESERDAFRVLAAATPEVRDAGIGEFSAAHANAADAVATAPVTADARHGGDHAASAPPAHPRPGGDPPTLVDGPQPAPDVGPLPPALPQHSTDVRAADPPDDKSLP